MSNKVNVYRIAEILEIIYANRGTPVKIILEPIEGVADNEKLQEQEDGRTGNRSCAPGA